MNYSFNNKKNTWFKFMLQHVSCSIWMFVQSVIPKNPFLTPFQTDMVLTACTQPNTPVILCSRLWLQCDRVSAKMKHGKIMKQSSILFIQIDGGLKDSSLFAICSTDKSHSRMLRDNKTVPPTCTLTNPVQLFSS